MWYVLGWSEHVLQWFDRGAPLAGDDLHELEAAAVQLHVGGVIVLCVDLACTQRTAVLGLHTHTHTQLQILCQCHHI